MPVMFNRGVIKRIEYMKKIFMILGAAMLVSAVSCQKGLEDNSGTEPVNPEVESSEFALIAHIAETKTTLMDG